jgi:hypothetical protein
MTAQCHQPATSVQMHRTTGWGRQRLLTDRKMGHCQWPLSFLGRLKYYEYWVLINKRLQSFIGFSLTHFSLKLMTIFDLSNLGLFWNGFSRNYKPIESINFSSDNSYSPCRLKRLYRKLKIFLNGFNSRRLHGLLVVMMVDYTDKYFFYLGNVGHRKHARSGYST